MGAKSGAGVGTGVEGAIVAGGGTLLTVLRRRLDEDVVGPLPSPALTVVGIMTAPKSSAPGT